LRDEVSGILCNPNTEFPLNFVPLRTFAAYLQTDGIWDARTAYLSALVEWLPRFHTIRGPASLDDLRLLGDCYYLPHEEGPDAETLHEHARQLLSRPSADWNGLAGTFCQEATRLREFCAGLAELRDRPLFHAIHRRISELREELDLLLRYVRTKQESPEAPCYSEYHLPGLYRGGIVARLQRLLTFRPDGAFEPGLPATTLSSMNSRPMP
jgi:protein O-GlcNAcase/histone acetyltransferase